MGKRTSYSFKKYYLFKKERFLKDNLESIPHTFLKSLYLTNSTIIASAYMHSTRCIKQPSQLNATILADLHSICLCHQASTIGHRQPSYQRLRHGISYLLRLVLLKTLTCVLYRSSYLFLRMHFFSFLLKVNTLSSLSTRLCALISQATNVRCS